ncbi:MAG: AAA family ATPase [Treponema sp.]|jgi:hypothetical protein|nr:AAA family ATPase [Treponema sp.]
MPGTLEAQQRINHCRERGEMELDLSDLGLEHIPPKLAELTHITTLNLSENNLKELPDCIGRLTELKYLDIHRNNLRSLPEAIGKLTELESLTLRGNELMTLPEAIGNLSSLKTLDISHNNLMALPETIGSLAVLQELDIRWNKLTALPETIGDLKALETLNLCGNELPVLPETIGELTAPKELTLLGHFEKIVELSEKNGLNKIFFDSAKAHLAFITQKLHITPIQGVFFAHFLNRCDDQSISINDIAESIKCSKIQLIQYMDDFDALEKKKFICGCRGRRTVSYRIPMEVINALRKGEAFTPVNHQHISITEFFTVVENLFEQRSENELTYDALAAELHTLLDDNMQLLFSLKIKSYYLDDDDMILLVFFCLLFINNDDDNISSHDFNDIYDSKFTFRNVKTLLEDGDHGLMERRLIENSNSEGFGDRESFKLTDKAKNELLAELHIKERQGKNKKGLILSGTLSKKKLFYNEKEAQHIQQLTALLEAENFVAVQKRLTDSGMRTGFACLFCGPPGTGKTETVYQLARATGRDIMMVNISETKSMWFGESEKRIKEVFDRYQVYVETSAIAPILLFNEADAIIGKRKEVTHSSVAQTENTIQNIILQEIENLHGILIATTNLTQNMDNAFERRFLYKIEFAKPNLIARQSIWQTMIPALSGGEAQTLASRYDFSGGQIENIARKRTIDSVISGTEPSIDTLIAFCQDELLARADTGRKIGFTNHPRSVLTHTSNG